MAGFAIRSQFIRVRIGVAGIAIGKIQRAVFLNFYSFHHDGFMAFIATHGSMLSFQRKSGGGMVEWFRIFKTLCIVTGSAVGAHLTLVVIGMTAGTTRIESQIGRCFLTQFRRSDMARLVTLFTIELRMRTLQLIAGQIVIKGGGIHLHQFKIATMMFVVAFDATLPLHFL